MIEWDQYSVSTIPFPVYVFTRWLILSIIQIKKAVDHTTLTRFNYYYYYYVYYLVDLL